MSDQPPAPKITDLFKNVPIMGTFRYFVPLYGWLQFTKVNENLANNGQWSEHFLKDEEVYVLK